MKRLKKFFKQTGRRWSWSLFRKRRILKRQVRDFLKDNVRFHFACGDKRLSGYVNIDIVPTEATDVTMDVARDLYLIPSNIAAEIKLESAFEHFYRYEQSKILQHFYRILKVDGSLVINWLPDFDAIIEAYLNKSPGIVGEVFDLFNVYRHTHGEPKARNSPFQLHKDIFTKDSIKYLLNTCGFYVERLENVAFPGERLAIGINIIAKKR